MSEIEQLKQRIDASGREGVETAHIRDDYEPIGATMIRDLCAVGDYVQRKVPPGGYDQKWKVFKKGNAPYRSEAVFRNDTELGSWNDKPRGIGT